MTLNGKLNSHAREQLALEVQAEALRPTPPLDGPSLQERLCEAWQRIRQLEDEIIRLRQRKRENQAQFEREVATQRRELMEDEVKRVREHQR